MAEPPTSADLPPQLRKLAAKADELPEALRAALQACLAAAARNSTPEQVLSATFTRLGYLPEEATRTARKLLEEVSSNSP